MPNVRRTCLAAIGAVMAAAAVALATLLPATAAESVADFYKGKTVTILMGTGPGGSFDLYGRTIADHLAGLIPGHPNIILQHMPGAGGVIAANYLYNTAPQDGTVILESHAITIAEMLTPSGVRFKSAKIQWLGAFDAIAQMMTLWHTVPVKTIADLKTADIAIGAFAKSHLTYQWASLLKDATGAKYKIVPGYPSGNACNLAMERGEIAGWTASWENISGTRPQWLAENKVRFLVQFTLKREPYLKDVPTLTELAPPDKRDVSEFVASGTPISRALAVGPGVPADRVAALRKAFDELMRDPAFLADAKTRKLSISPRNAAEVEALVKKTVTASPDLIARVKKAIGLAQ
jgi:tripartite-type tricarboxylate transporter receptor subunit TctC